MFFVLVSIFFLFWSICSLFSIVFFFNLGAFHFSNSGVSVFVSLSISYFYSFASLRYDIYYAISARAAEGFAEEKKP